MEKSFYFDYAASTPVDPDVLEEMLPYFIENFGNSSSIHQYGQKAENALDLARQTCAELLNTSFENVIFTSGGTESDNHALRGIAHSRRRQFGADEILISPVEHHAVLHTVEQLRDDFGFKVAYLPVFSDGLIDLDGLRNCIHPKTAVVSVIYANNEIGSINPIKEIGAICREKEIPFHSDAVQAAAHLPMDMANDNLSLISIGAHKMYGPKGVGLLGLRDVKRILPIQTGGGQEFNLRAGTQNIPLIVGLAASFKKAQKDTSTRNSHLRKLRDRLIDGILTSVNESSLTGHPNLRLPNHASFVFSEIDGNQLIRILDANGFCCSSGSACKVGSPSPSNVLLETGYSRDLALSSLRITLGKENSLEQVNELIKIIDKTVTTLRK